MTKMYAEAIWNRPLIRHILYGTRMYFSRMTNLMAKIYTETVRNRQKIRHISNGNCNRSPYAVYMDNSVSQYLPKILQKFLIRDSNNPYVLNLGTQNVNI